MRYLRLYLYFVRFSFSRAMEFRFDFFFRVVMDTVFYVTNLAFFAILLEHTPVLGGWNLDQIMIFTCGFLLLDAVNMTLFANNFWHLPLLINRGDLDYYLVRPVSSLFFVSLRDFAANSFLNLVIAASIMAYYLAQYPGELGAGRIALFLCLLLVGSALYYAIHMMFILPTFWLHSATGLRELFWQIEKVAERPDQIFGGWLRRFFLSVLPLALIVSYPTHVLFEGPSIGRLGHIALGLAWVFACMLFLWSRGLRAYASASS
jgi:ABC-2 type transport system permease protein